MIIMFLCKCTSSLVSWLKLYSWPTITFSRLISTQLSLNKKYSTTFSLILVIVVVVQSPIRPGVLMPETDHVTQLVNNNTKLVAILSD